MKDINFSYDDVYELIHRACTRVSSEEKSLMEKTLERETNLTAQNMIKAMLDNIALAEKGNKPVCQSPGYPTVYVSFGDKVLPGNLKELFQKAVSDITNSGFLRPSMVHPITRENSGDNSGVGMPNFEYDYVPGQEYLEAVISFKGCGAELGNAMKIFTCAQLGENYAGVRKFVLETVINAGGKPCPPFGLGIGIGGQMDVACKLSRRAISTRPWDDKNPEKLFSDLEEELLEQINSLQLGAAGTGGDTIAMAVKINAVSTHTAITPIAINFHCWPLRRAGIRLYPDGHKENIF